MFLQNRLHFSLKYCRKSSPIVFYGCRTRKNNSSLSRCFTCNKKVLLTMNSLSKKYLNFVKHIYSTRNVAQHYSTIQNIIEDNENAVKNYLDNLMNLSLDNHEVFSKKIENQTSNSYRVLQLLTERISIHNSIKSLHDLNSDNKGDKEMEKLIETEKCDYNEKIKVIDNELISCLIPEEPYDMIDDVIVEVKHGVGGQEAMLFAKDLFQMYCGYATHKGWDYCIDELTTSDLGGIRSSSIIVCGPGALKHYCYEAGVHRVQRIPTTEKGGRMHTSTVSVAVLAQPTEVDVKLNEKDLKIETKRASGAGGQHVNTTDSAVRIIHLPTGVNVECQTERSQIKNKQIALKKLRAKLFQAEVKEQLEKINRTRKLQVGSGGRSEKIRTYNFQQDRITDHRIGFTGHNVEIFLSGTEDFDKLIKCLKEEAEVERITEFIRSLRIT